MFVSGSPADARPAWRWHIRSGGKLWWDSLIGEDLRGADFRGRDLRGVNMRSANLSGAVFNGADLREADLFGATLHYTDFRGADLRCAWLDRTRISRAKFDGARLDGTILDPDRPLPWLSDEEITAGGLVPHGERVYGYRMAQYGHYGLSIPFTPRAEPYVAPVFSCAHDSPYHPGIYIYSLGDMLGKYVGYSRVYCYCLREELLHAKHMWRCKRLWVVA